MLIQKLNDDLTITFEESDSDIDLIKIIDHIDKNIVNILSLTINLHHVKYINSSIISIIIHCLKKCDNQKLKYTILNKSECIDRILNMVKIKQMFPEGCYIYDNDK